MKDISLFNQSYLGLLRQFVISDFGLKEEADLISEIKKSSQATTDCLSKSPILVVEPDFSLHDLSKWELIDVPGNIVKLNFSYLTLINMLARENIRTAMMYSKCTYEQCEAIKSMSADDIRHAANCNQQLCVCNIHYLNIRRASNSEKEIDPKSFRSNFLQHLPLFQFRQV